MQTKKITQKGSFEVTPLSSKNSWKLFKVKESESKQRKLEKLRAQAYFKKSNLGSRNVRTSYLTKKV